MSITQWRLAIALSELSTGLRSLAQCKSSAAAGADCKQEFDLAACRRLIATEHFGRRWELYASVEGFGRLSAGEQWLGSLQGEEPHYVNLPGRVRKRFKNSSKENR